MHTLSIATKGSTEHEVAQCTEDTNRMLHANLQLKHNYSNACWLLVKPLQHELDGSGQFNKNF